MKNNQNQAHSDEVTLRELILAVQRYSRYFFAKWYWVLLGAALGGGLFLYLAYSAKTNYSAPITFVLNNEKDVKVGTGSILGSLGLGGESVNNGAKLVEMARSRQLLENVLFDSVIVEGNKELIANHLIEQYSFHEHWKDSEHLNNYLFKKGLPDKKDKIGNSAYKQLYNLLAGIDGLCTSEVDEFTGIFTINTTSIKPELSIAITEGLYRELTKYYVRSTISGREHTYNNLKIRADSVKNELSIAEGRLARFQDQTRRVLNLNTVKEQELSREVLILNTMYVEIVKNKETTAFLLANDKPAFSVIDSPLEPLRVSGVSVIRNLILGVLLGGFVVLIGLFFQKLYSEIMASEH